MKSKHITWTPVIGSAMLIIFYLLSLRFRGLFTAQEYDFALMLQQLWPAANGTYLPKLPAALATLATGGILYLAAHGLRLLHPGNTAAMYLCFPLTWWVGTSASSAPVLALFIVIAAAGLFLAHREKNLLWKLAGFSIGLLGAAAAAYLAQTVFFNWTGTVLAILPLLFLTFAIRLEKLDDRGTAERKLNIFTVVYAVVIIMLMVLLLAPAVCRFLKISFPAALTVFRAGEHIYQSAAALIIALIWLFFALKTAKSSDKVSLICFATGLLLLFLPATLPWSRISKAPQPESLMKIYPEIMVNDPVFFADASTSSAVSFLLKVPVQRVGRAKNELPPPQLAEAIIQKLEQGKDAVIFSDLGELDSFLPEDKVCTKFTSQKQYKIFLFKGDKK